MRKRATIILLVLAALAAGCGSDDEQGEPIPAATAADLQSRLDEVERRFDFGGGACGDIQNDSKPAVDQIVSSLPADVDADTRDALQQSFDRLFELSDDECTQDEDEPEPETLPEPPPETETVPPETETVPPETETVPPETEEEPPLETQPPVEPPADEDDGTGGGGTISPGDEG